MNNPLTPDLPKEELIWVSADVAKKFNALADGSTAEAYILEYIQALKQDIHISVESLDEDILLLRAKGIAYKQAFRAAFEEEKAAIYELWEESQARGEEAKKAANKQTQAIRQETQAIKELAEELTAAIETLNIWKIESALTTIQNLQATLANLTPELKQAMKAIINEN